MNPESMKTVTQLIYLVSTGLFILSLKWMGHPSTARNGVIAGVVAMVAAIGGTLLTPGLLTYGWIAAAVVIGCLAGVPLSWVPLTAVPQRRISNEKFIEDDGLIAGVCRAAKTATDIAG